MKKYVGILILSIIILTGCTNKNNDLSCTYTDNYNVTYETNYTFKNGVVATINQKISTPISMVQNPDAFKKDYDDINENVDGCEASYKEENGFYITDYKCDITLISNEDAKRVFSQSKEELKQTRKSIIDFHNNEESEKNDKKTICK